MPDSKEVLDPDMKNSTEVSQLIESQFRKLSGTAQGVANNLRMGTHKIYK
jgi:hypothetical protein